MIVLRCSTQLGAFPAGGHHPSRVSRHGWSRGADAMREVSLPPLTTFGDVVLAMMEVAPVTYQEGVEHRATLKDG